jgi:NADH dehydrogenase/NADH:ubiquinone oxidoreductase subunit G
MPIINVLKRQKIKAILNSLDEIRNTAFYIPDDIKKEILEARKKLSVLSDEQSTQLLAKLDEVISKAEKVLGLVEEYASKDKNFAQAHDVYNSDGKTSLDEAKRLLFELKRIRSRISAYPALTSPNRPALVEPTITSSPIQNKARQDRMGGIDFRSLPIVTQAVRNLSGNIGSLSISRFNSINLNSEWQEIENLVNSGIVPSAERIKEYVQTSCYNANIDKDVDKLILCISDILRLEEERCSKTDPILRDILVVLESVSSTQQLRATFIGATP